MVTDTKTNNSYLGNKIDLRLNNLPPGDISVLDCYGGARLIWKAIEECLDRPVRYIGIDRDDYGIGFYLPGDNLGYLTSLDLTRFNVIDLDAWGVPYEQLKILFERGYRGRVFVTMTQVVMGKIPKGLIEDIGFTAEMYSACPTIFGKRGWQYFLEWLALKGVRTITHRSHAKKHYLTFEL